MSLLKNDVFQYNQNCPIRISFSLDTFFRMVSIRNSLKLINEGFASSSRSKCIELTLKLLPSQLVFMTPTRLLDVTLGISNLKFSSSNSIPLSWKLFS